MFWPELGNPDDTPRRKAPTRQQKQKQREAEIDPHAIGCDACKLRQTWGRISTKQMPLSGAVRTGEVLALAEAPGEEEDRRGVALIGPSGQLLREHIPGRFRNTVAYQNVVRCRPDGNRTPTTQEAHACSTYLDKDIAYMRNLKVILGLGAVPLRRFFPGASITKVHGLVFPVRVGERSYWYFPAMHPAFVLRDQEDEEGYDPPSLPVFRADIQHCFNHMESWGKPYIHRITRDDVILPQSYEEAKALRDRMQEPIGVDLETIKLRPYERGAELLTAALSDGKITIAFPINHPSGPTTWGLRLLIDTVQRYRWIAHNAAMELPWLLHYMGDGSKLLPFDDSMACARLHFERESVLSMEEVSHIVLGINVKSITGVDASRIMDYPLPDTLVYNGHDALGCRLIWDNLHARVDQGGYDRIIGAIRATTPMEVAGLPVDQQVARELKAEWQARREQIRTEVRQLYEVRQFEAERGIEFKITSNEHVGTALVAYGGLNLPRTKKGEIYSTEEKELRAFADSNMLARYTLDDREATKMVSTYIDPTLEAPARYADGLLHPTYTTMLVSTLRLSSRDPNAQNYPWRKHGEIRRQFPAPRGRLYAKFDYGQLEARVLAMASRDKRLIQALIDKFDIHSYWLNKVLDDYYPDYFDRLADKTGVKEEKRLRKVGRDLIKSDLVFNALYGGGAASIAQRTGIPLHTVLDILSEFWDEYRGVKQWHKERRYEYRDTGAIRTLTGRVRRGILSGNEPINTPIQGTAADIVIEAMNEVAALARERGDSILHPRINVHDDLTFFLPDDDDELPRYIDCIHPMLTRIRFPFQIVPLTVELKIGQNWAELEEVTTFEGPYRS